MTPKLERLIGREALLEFARDQVARHRIVCVHGSPGSGKSALMRALTAEGEGRVVFDLAHRSRWLEELGRALDGQGAGEMQTWAARLRAAQISVLALDHVGGEASSRARQLLELARACPDVRLIVATRAQWIDAAVRCVRVKPLGIKDAMRLYRHACAQIHPHLVIGRDDEACIAPLVDALGGLPLALWAAAAQAVTMPAGVLLEALQDGEPWVDTRHIAPSRQLARSIERALDDLPESDSTLLRQLDVFAQPFTSEEVTHVVASDLNARQRLQALTIQGLVVPEDAADVTNRLKVEPNVARALRPTAVTAALVQARLGYARWVCGKLIPPEPGHLGFMADTPDALQALERAQASIRRAKSYRMHPFEAQAALALARHAWRRRSRRQALVELQGVDAPQDDWACLVSLTRAEICLDLGQLERAHAHTLAARERTPQGAAPPLRALVAVVEAAVDQAHGQGDAIGRLNKALLMIQAFDPSVARTHLLMFVLLHLGLALAQTGRAIPASALFGRGIALSDQVHADHYLGASMRAHNAQLLHRLGQRAQARQMMQSALKSFQALGVRRAQAQALGALAMMMHADEQHQGALNLYDEGLAVSGVDATSWGYQRDALKGSYGLLRLQMGDVDEAHELIEHAAYLVQGRADPQAHHLQVLLGVLLYRQGRFDAAHHQFESLRDALKGASSAPSESLNTLLHGFIALNALARDPDAEAEALQGAMGLAYAVEERELTHLGQALLHALFVTEYERLSACADDAALEIHAEERWVRRLDERVDMRRRGPMWRLLLCLARAHREQPGQPVHAVDLFLQGWPQTCGTIPESGMHRLYSTMNRLRNLGFDSIIVTLNEGYLIKPATKIVWIAEETP